jgi:hypothetical protein
MSSLKLAALALYASHVLALTPTQHANTNSRANIDSPLKTRRTTSPAAFSAPSLDVNTTHYLPLTFVPGKQKQRKPLTALSNAKVKRSKAPGYGAAPLDNDVYTGNFNVEVKLGEQVFSVGLRWSGIACPDAELMWRIGHD